MDVGVVLAAERLEIVQIVGAPLDAQAPVVHDEETQAGLRPAIVLRSAGGPLTGEVVAHQGAQALLLPRGAAALDVAGMGHG